MTFEIRLFGDPVLRTKARPVTSFDGSLEHLARRMIGTLSAGEGRAALAANQVGVLKRLFVAEIEGEGYAVVNPVIEELTREKETDLEGCLSIPEIWVEVERHRGIVVSGRGPGGAPLRFETSGRVARMMQHEIDHLDGVLMLDRTDRASRRRAMRQWRGRLLSRG